jgi:hypothetical protein
MVGFLMLFKKRLALYSENYAKPTNTLLEQSTELYNITACGTHRVHSCDLKG